MIAFLEMQRVGSHGHPMSEATSPLANPQNPGREWDYSVEVYTDFAEARLNEFKRDFRQRYGDDAQMDDRVFIVKKTSLKQ